MVIQEDIIPVSADTKIRKRPIKLALVSCGLGHINRGVEVSTARCYEALKNNESLTVRLFSGGQYPGAQKINNIPRDLLLRTIFAPMSKLDTRRIWELCYGIEQITFAAGFGSTLLSWQPDIVWTKETPLAHVFTLTRPLFKLKYRLIFANGCGFKPQTYAGFDYIQHLHQQSFEEALQFGIPTTKMTVLPNFGPILKINKTRDECRKYFGYESDDFVITCAAAWNCYHKRIDYLIAEVAKIKDEKVKLLLCGHPEPDAPYLKELAHKLLPGRVQWHTLPADLVPMAIKAADVFVLPSLNELFGGVLIEAVMIGTPVIAHHTAASHQLMEQQFKTYDLSHPDNLANSLVELRKSPPSQDEMMRVANAVELSFSQEALCRQFVEMVNKVLTSAGK